ncbi:MAG: hypothetical protein Q7S00_03080, partial [bacterium]|nr:hypothetical protein [bacterium]
FTDGLNINSAKSAAIIIQTHPDFLKKELIGKAVNFLLEEVSRTIGGGAVFRGVYDDFSLNSIDVYVIFNGVTYPHDRFQKLFQDVKSGISAIKRKENRIDAMAFDTDSEEMMPSLSFQKIKSRPVPKLMIPCTNCRLDPMTKLSKNLYKDGGPVHFSSGRCPVCRGAGMTEVREGV